MNPPSIPAGRLRHIVSDGIPVWKLQCPGCGEWGEIDDDQLHGRVSVDHTDELIPCTFHETRDWWNTAEHEDQRKASVVIVAESPSSLVDGGEKAT